ncbi:ATP-grasp domain-containing protein [Streptomyces sp. NPDC051162]|uniref:ATP-grasp domain-containing protein n=1 Tax=unclassified Streptomyces TaxID=2593676 RepID=UPI00342F57C8
METVATGTDFVQLGATRDGLDPYLDCARRRSLRAVLVETPAYLRWRELLGRRPFDLEIAVEEPQDPEQVREALAAAGVRPALLLAGFERYVYTGFALARSLRALPWPSAGEDFRPLDKQELRTAVRRVAGHLAQPRQLLLGAETDGETEEIGYPQVIKPVDGGGGLGVLLVRSADRRPAALKYIESLANYGGGEFAGVVTEEFVEGPEVSLQGVAHAGRPTLLSVCEKLTAIEDIPDAPDLAGFREVGHIARHGSTVSPELLDLARSCLDATGYREGPFHIDAILGPDGPVLVEMGFRLSGGGLVALIERATGADWAELAFRTHLDGADPHNEVQPDRARSVGQIRAVSEDQLTAATALAPAGCSVETVPAGPAPSLAELTADELTVLASDITRHSGSVGRVLVTSAQDGDVRSALSSLVENRRRD